MKAVCEICPHHCAMEEGQTGYCRARKNVGGKVLCENYGKLTALALDPVEKKPLRRFYPGSMLLSVGSYGCNLRCPFCQNHEISMTGADTLETQFVPPEGLVQKAAGLTARGNIGIAYTYNEPLIGYEYVRDCAALAQQHGLKNVLVTNGTVCEAPLLELLPLIDAMNIDLKGFGPKFYEKLGGDLETVKHTIARAAAHCHVEVTTLIIPGENDSEGEMRALSAWLAGVNPGIPLHVSRFFPCYEMGGRTPTPVETVYRLTEIAREQLRYVYTGNC